MPTLARLRLASACLLMAPVAVMADELPKDTNKITSLTVAEAKRLVETFPGVDVKGENFLASQCLPLNGLTAVDAETAEVLAGWDKGQLFLNGLTALSNEAAKALAQNKGMLALNGLKMLSEETAEAIARQSGGLELNGLSTVSDEAASRLAQYKGNFLSLDGLTTLNADTAKAIAETKAWDGQLPNLTMLDAATANALAQFKGEGLFLTGLTTLDTETAEALVGVKGEIWLTGLQRASFGAVSALRQNPRIYMPDHWYLLRYQIAALVGTVVFVVLAGVVVWYSRRPSNAALN